MSTRRLKIYYDGSCPICAREMSEYRRRDREGVFEFIDITAPRFEAHLHGRSQEAFMARLHVRDAEGRFHTGIDAFAAIWEALGGAPLEVLARFVRLPGVHLLATLGYEAFARIRPWLPKKIGGCDDDSCRWGHPHPR